MKAAILAIAAFALVGCVTSEEGVPDPYGLAERERAFGTWCRARIQPPGIAFTPTDSGATCSDGTAARHFETEWVASNPTCSVTELADVVGGFAGIRKVWGCRR